MSKKFKQGLFKPINPKKYIGDPTKIVYRSSWEYKLLKHLDTSDKIKGYGSEEIVIPYLSPIDNKTHRYFVDFIIVGTNNKVLLLEVKPHAQTKVPKKTPKKTQERLLYEVNTYLVNQAKWKYAEEYCKKRGWEFKVLTEKEINFI